jgi:hypothetical protein
MTPNVGDVKLASGEFFDLFNHPQFANVAILAPMFFKDKRQKAEGREDEVQRIWFKVVYVFDRFALCNAP